MEPEGPLAMREASSGSMMLTAEEADSRLDLADAVPVTASRASRRLACRFTSSPVRPERSRGTSVTRVNGVCDKLLENAGLAQSDESEEEAEEEQQAEQEAEQPLPPAAAGAQAEA